MGTISDSHARSGINETTLDNTILELNNDIDKIDYLLHQVEMLIYDSSDYFKGKVADSIRDKFKVYTNQIDILKQNLSSYPNDLLAVRASMIANDLASANILNTYSEEINAQAKNTRVN